MDELREIERILGHDPVAAQEGFSRMMPRMQGFLWRYLSKYLPRPQDREDVIAKVLARIWEKRQMIELQGLGAWWAYVATVGRRGALDLLERPESKLGLDLSAFELELVDEVADMSQDAGALYRAADELWLGLEAGTSSSEANRRLLAAQLFYVHGQNWHHICTVLGHKDPVSRQVLERWLTSGPVLSQLSFSHLYRDNDRLAGHLLSDGSHLSGAELDSLTKKAVSPASDPPEGWTWEQVRVAIWHYRNGLSSEKIVQMAPEMGKEFVERTIRQLSERLPFKPAAAQLLQAFSSNGTEGAPLRAPGLWKRLAFQYHAYDDLPQKQILERTEPSAKIAGYKINAGILNAWLSNGRIFVQLIAYVQGKR